MTWTGPGFVDHHAHLLHEASLQGSGWGGTAAIRALHHACAERGDTPVDAIEQPECDDLPAALRAALHRAAAAGLVEIWEAGTRHPAYWTALRALRDEGPLPLRVRILVAAGLAERGMPERLGDAWLDVVGVKFYADGWLGPRTCALSAEFRDEPGNAGLLFEPPDHLARRIEPFAHAGWTIATHAIGDRAIESVLDAYERVYGDGCAAASPRIEHAQLLQPDLVARMAALGVVACIQPGFAIDDAEDARAGLGDAWPFAYRWSALLDAGVRVVTGSDYPIDDLEPLRGLAKLMSNPFDSLSRTDALRLMTRSDAGTMTLSVDPADVAVGSPSDIQVLATNPSG
ncbi:MAG: amidohydrolase family protein [Candidatus Dormiibacterota bacterium]